MTKKKQPQTYFTSDFHLGHHSDKTGRGIMTFERNQFKTIQEHDDYIWSLVKDWSLHWPIGSTLYYLGDFGAIENLSIFNMLRDNGIKVVFLAGNHDKAEDYSVIKYFVDEFYEYPIYLSKKLVVSHEPVGVWEDTINVHGHLHGASLAKDNYLNASLHVADYKPITMQHVNSYFSKLPKYNRRFLYEPFADMMKFTQSKEDVVMDKDGLIDLSASRVLQRIHAEQRKANGDNSYQPYIGTLE